SGIMASKFGIPFSWAYNNHAALSTQTRALSAKVFRRSSRLVIFAAYAYTSGRMSSNNWTGFENDCPSTIFNAYSLTLNIRECPPVSECPHATLESDHNTP